MNHSVSRSALRYPDFICIGAQKAGTTWLYKMLVQHKDVWLPPVKVLHYFDTVHQPHFKQGKKRKNDDTGLDTNLMNSITRVIGKTRKVRGKSCEMLRRIYSLSLVGTRELTDEWYGRIFQSAPEDAVCGEITPSYALLPEKGAQHIASLCKNVKIIFVMRDPIERGWSELKMLLRRKNNPADDRVLLEKAASRLFLERGDYFATIERFRQYTPKENFLPVYFDNLTQQPKEFLGEICDFLGLDIANVKFRGLGKQIHKGQSDTIKRELYDEIRANLVATCL